MRFSGEDFFKHFFCEFQQYVSQNMRDYSNTRKDSEWTSYVKDSFLNDLAGKLGFKEIQREGIYAIDLTWEKPLDETSVVIEHENEVKSIWENEVPNLLKAKAPLKVLITYVDDTEFPGKEIANRLLNYLKDANFDQEFLLILGSCSMAKPTDWAGFLYKPEVTCINVIYCSNALQAERSPGKKAAKTRKERMLG